MSDDMQTICEALGVAVPAGELDAAGLVFAKHLAVLDDMMRCPVTMEAFEEPVTTVDGFQLERSAAEAWFARGHNTSIVTGKVLHDLSLTPSPMCGIMRALFVDGGSLLAAPVRVDTTEVLLKGHITAMSMALLCPITLERFEHPILTSDGHSYEYVAFVDWLRTGQNSSPLTGLELTRRVIYQNRLVLALLRLIVETEEELALLQA